MRAIREVRPPGVYPVGTESQSPLTIADTHVAGIVGISSKGPLNTPTRLQSWNEFVEIFGNSPESYMARAVEGFFMNGGKTCYVVRVARLPRPGDAPGVEHAVPAARFIRDGWDKNTLRVTALNEGRWGNNIWVRFAQTTGQRTLLTLDLEVGSGEARVNSTRGIERGTLLRIYDRGNSDYVVVTEVNDKTIRWGNSTPIVRGYQASSPTYVEVIEIEVYATLKERREVFRGLQMSSLSRRYAPRVVNEQSFLIRLEDLGSTSPLPHNLPLPGPADKLAGGRDGIEGITAEDFVGFDHGMNERRGLHTLAHVDEVGLLLCPDAMLAYRMLSAPEARGFVQRVQSVMVDICENTQDRFAILDMPMTRDVEQVRHFRQHRESSYAASYFPWLEVPGPGGTQMVVPPSGHVAGVYARCDIGQGVNKAPANEVLQGVTQLTLPLTDDHIGQLNLEGVNTLRAFTGRGIRIWGARTMSSDPDWRYVNVRRLFIMLRRSLHVGTQWVTFEPNTPKTWATLRQEIARFLRSLWTRGYFAGGTEEQSFLVKCDEETNPREVVESGRLIVDIRVAPSLPAEYIMFTLEQQLNEQAVES